MKNFVKKLAFVLVTLAAFNPAGEKADAQVDPLLGQIILVGFNFCPRGYHEADGSLLSIPQYTALFALYGTMYGGDGRSTFGLPDLRGRVPIGAGLGPGLSNYRQGSKGGAETVTLTISQIPSHSHTLNGVSERATTSDAAGNKLAKSGSYRAGGTDAALAGSSIGSTGGGQAHENRPPYLTLRYCVATQGVFPSRN